MGSYGKFVADIAGQVGIGGFPFAGFGVFENQVAQFGFDLFFGLAIEFGDVVEIDAAMLVERDEQPLLGALHPCDRRGLANHVPRHDGSFCGLAGHFVIVLKRHDKHGIRVFLKLHDVGHPADDAAIGGFAERGLVDRAVGAGKAVVGSVQFAAGIGAMFVGPAFVLRLQDAAGVVTQFNQCAKSLAGQRAIGFEGSAAVNDGHTLPALRLINSAVITDEEAAFADMTFGRRRYKGRCRFHFICRCLYRLELRKLLNGIAELSGQIAIALYAETFASIERVLA